MKGETKLHRTKEGKMTSRGEGRGDEQEGNEIHVMITSKGKKEGEARGMEGRNGT